MLVNSCQFQKSVLRLPDVESPTISSNPGSLGFPGCALLALVRPVPPTLAPSLQRSRSVPWPVVLDVQSCTPWCFSGPVMLLLFGRCGHRQISTVTRFQAHPSGSCTGHEVLALVRPVVPSSLALSSKRARPVVSPAPSADRCLNPSFLPGCCPSSQALLSFTNSK